MLIFLDIKTSNRSHIVIFQWYLCDYYLCMRENKTKDNINSIQFYLSIYSHCFSSDTYFCVDVNRDRFAYWIINISLLSADNYNHDWAITHDFNRLTNKICSSNDKCFIHAAQSPHLINWISKLIFNDNRKMIQLKEGKKMDKKQMMNSSYQFNENVWERDFSFLI